MSSENRTFWNNEYGEGKYLALSTKPSNELLVFEKWLGDTVGQDIFDIPNFVFDAGCGNGRNLNYLAEKYSHISGIGIDISDTAITIANQMAQKSKPETERITFKQGSLGDSEFLEREIVNGQVDIVLDMMASHVLNTKERKDYTAQLARIVRPGGWVLFKTFLRDGDDHALRMIKQHPASEDEPYAYIHPTFGVYEYVWAEDDIHEVFARDFIIHKIRRSHGHVSEKGGAGKRRFMVVYMERK